MKSKFLNLLYILPISIVLCSCDLAIKEGHEHTVIIDEAILPTCTEVGYTAGSHCSTCGKTIIVPEIILATGHKIAFDEGVAATCTEDGLTYGAHCETCGEILESQKVIPHTGHYVVGLPGTPASCTESGLTGGSYCTTCGEIIEPQEVIPAYGHVLEITSRKEATCTEDGHTELVICGRCHEVIVEPVVIEHIGHIHYTDFRVEPTCTEPGLTEGSHCKTCGEVFAAQEVIPPLGHNYVITERKEATCTQDGHTQGLKCSRCNEVFEESHTIAKKGHELIVDHAKEATCTEPGLTVGSHCLTCGEVLVPQTEIAPLGHHFVVREAVSPDCTHTGKTLEVVCDTCGYHAVESNVIPANGHTKGSFVSLVTTSVQGVKNPGLFQCAVCGNEYYDTVTSEDINFPILSIDGEFGNIDMTQKWFFDVKYEDGNRTENATGVLNWQNEYSSIYPKKNYDVTFYTDSTLSTKKGIEFKADWGVQSTYALKADYIDRSHIRDLGTASIYRDIAATRENGDALSTTRGYGVTDGKPVLIYQNGTFQGLYNIETPKDGWAFDMSYDITAKHAAMTAKAWTNSNALKEEIAADFSNGWDLNFSSTGSNNAWVVESFNKLINFVKNNENEDFINGISNFLNVDRAIDQMLLTWLMRGSENYTRNIVWTTYDGNIWIPNISNAQSTWGLNGSGEITINPTPYLAYETNLLWEKLFNYMRPQIVSRWQTLRSGPLSLANITTRFTELTNLYPSFILEADSNKWSDMPGNGTNTLEQILNFANACLASFDETYQNSII